MEASAPDVIDVVQRVQIWVRQHERLVDVLFAALLAFTAIADVAGVTRGSARELDPLGIALIAIGSSALIWRRRHSLATLAVVFVVLAIYYTRDYGSFMSVVGIAAVYAVAAHLENRRTAWIASSVYSITIFGVAWLTILDEPDGHNLANATNMATYLVGGTIVGAVVRNRQRLFADSERRVKQAERDRVVEAERAVAGERIRIAREMHDVVAHGMSVITVQAAAAQQVLATDTDAASNALAQIETVGRESLNEMRRMLNVLRGNNDENSDFEPQPKLADISKLIDRCVEADLPTDLTVTGIERELPAGLGLAAYRIVQESLTNVVKHAGSNARARVQLDYGDRALEIRISDDGRGAITSFARHHGGNGLIGMRERVDVYAGEFEAGPVVGGGYSVRAVLPIERASDRPGVASIPDGHPTSVSAATT